MAGSEQHNCDYPPYEENESEAAYNSRIEDELNDCCSYNYKGFVAESGPGSDQTQE